MKELNVKIPIKKVEVARHINIDKCYFCESSKLSLSFDFKVERNTMQKGLWFIECNNCKAQGSKEKIMSDAIARWNKEPQRLTKNKEKTLFD